MLCVIKNKNVAGRSLCRDDMRILGHVARSVHFSLVIDSNLDFDFSGNGAEAAELAFLRIIVRCVHCGVFSWKLNGGDKKVVLFVRGMCTEDKTMCVVIAGLGYIWKPLGSKRGPFKSMCNNKIVEKRGIFLPDLVF